MTKPEMRLSHQNQTIKLVLMRKLVNGYFQNRSSNVKPRLSKSVIQLRNQIDDAYPLRDRRTDGTVGDSKHDYKSDHTPDALGWVRALDVDADLTKHKSESIYLANQIRLYAKSDPAKRISYVIHNKKIASRILNWKWRKYTGINPHTSHIHVSFNKGKADTDGSFFEIPMLGGNT